MPANKQFEPSEDIWKGLKHTHTQGTRVLYKKKKKKKYQNKLFKLTKEICKDPKKKQKKGRAVL